MLYFKQALNNIFKYEGRSNRKEFWLYLLISINIISLWIFIFSLFFGLGLAGDSGFFDNIGPRIGFSLPFIPFYIVLSSLLVRRLHDFGQSGWLVFLVILFLPVGLLLCGFCRSDPKPNRYGNVPEYKFSSENQL
ncbi:MAG: DUF805 domain-containing protein [Deltaproteobacteria bacterium]|jgi:uncharacterized membrane protein YhaH (DUF805 family)|nr:DUF805 domain-containing protein [Deltaproteobacteria bacterium]